jgi:hypothetical protein
MITVSTGCRIEQNFLEIKKLRVRIQAHPQFFVYVAYFTTAGR